MGRRWRRWRQPTVRIPMEWMGARIRVRVGDQVPILDLPIVGLASMAPPTEEGWWDLIGPQLAPRERQLSIEIRRG